MEERGRSVQNTAVLILDDGELDDVQAILDDLHFSYGRVRGGAVPNERAFDPQAWSAAEVHLAIPELLERLESDRRLDDVAAELTLLGPLLREHFAEEEDEGGYFDELQAAMPSACDTLNRLRVEHAEILQQIESLQRLVGDGQERVDTIHADVRALAATIREHHRAEEALLQEAYLRDIRGG